MPAPGRIRLNGAGLRTFKRKVDAKGTVKLPLKPKGKALRSLNRRGRAKVKAKISFKPPYGTARTVTKRITLIRN